MSIILTHIVLHNMFTSEEIFNLMQLIGLEKYSSSIKITLFQNGMGAFLVLGLLIALFQFIGDRKQNEKIEEVKEESTNA